MKAQGQKVPSDSPKQGQECSQSVQEQWSARYGGSCDTLCLVQAPPFLVFHVGRNRHLQATDEGWGKPSWHWERQPGQRWENRWRQQSSAISITYSGGHRQWKLDRVWSFLLCSPVLFLLCFPISLCQTLLFPDQTMFSFHGGSATAARNEGKTELSGEREVTGGLEQIHWDVFFWNYIKWLLCQGGPSVLQCELPSAGCLSGSSSFWQLKLLFFTFAVEKHLGDFCLFQTLFC